MAATCAVHVTFSTAPSCAEFSGRFDGPSSMAEFAQAFACKKGDAMVREKVCKIW